MKEIIEKYKEDYQINISEHDNLKTLVIGEFLGSHIYYKEYEKNTSNEEIIKKAKKIIDNYKCTLHIH
tara:strand:+ start:72 stop:275 length:204 start_codon:yes stop_codon:yes gene_type:complete